MEMFNEFTGFDWDKGNIKKNALKHQVNQDECEEVFFNEPVFVYYDDKHSFKEARFYLLGKTDKTRLIFLVFTIRSNRIRVISARNMNKKERSKYNEKAKKYT